MFSGPFSGTDGQASRVINVAAEESNGEPVPYGGATNYDESHNFNFEAYDSREDELSRHDGMGDIARKNF